MSYSIRILHFSEWDMWYMKQMYGIDLYNINNVIRKIVEGIEEPSNES